MCVLSPNVNSMSQIVSVWPPLVSFCLFFVHVLTLFCVYLMATDYKNETCSIGYAVWLIVRIQLMGQDKITENLKLMNIAKLVPKCGQ